MSTELGMLAVVVLKARNLHDRHSFYKQDPFAKVTLNGKTFKTDPDVKGGQRPEWDAEFRFPVYTVKNDSSRMMEVTCWRAEPKGDEEIGKGKVDIGDTLKKGEFDDWVTINDVSGTYRGEIYLEMTFFSSGPPPLARRPSKLPPQERLQYSKKHSAAPVTGGNLAVPGGAPVHEPGPPKKGNSLLSVYEPPAPAPAPTPSTLRPGTGLGIVNGQERHSSGYKPPINSPPPLSLFPGRPSASPVQQPNIQQPNSTSPFRIPGQDSRTSSVSGYGSSYSSPLPGHSPPRLSYSPPHPAHTPPRPSYSPPRSGHTPPRPSYSPPRQNPYLTDPVPQSDQGSTFFPSPHIVVDSTPPVPYDTFNSVSSYPPPRNSPPRHSPPISQPLPPSITTGAPNFPSVSPQPSFHPPQPTSSSYPPPQSNYPPSQPGYAQPQCPYSPPSHPEYPGQAPPQFPSHYATFNDQPQSTYTPYGHTPPAPGPGQRPFFGRGDSVGEFPDPGLTQRYSSPLPLPNDRKQSRTGSPFPVPAVPPPQHSVSSTFSPSAEYEWELQSRREQEERDAELAKRLDFELNLSGR